MGSVSNNVLWGAADQRAQEARLAADVAALRGMDHAHASLWRAARPSPLRGEALNAGFRYLEVTCADCDTCNTVDLTRGRRATEMPIWQPERRMRCRPCSDERGNPDQAWASGSAATDQHHDRGRWPVLVYLKSSVADTRSHRTRANIWLIAALMVLASCSASARMT
jgi:hypothetical protein